MGFTGGSVEPASAGVQSLVLKIPRTGGQLGPSATTSGLVPWSLGAAAAETHTPWSQCSTVRAAPTVRGAQTTTKEKATQQRSRHSRK